MLQIKSLKFITKCSYVTWGEKGAHQRGITVRVKLKLKLKLEPNGNLQPPAAAETKERWFLYIRRPFSSFSPPPPPPPFFLIINSAPISFDACSHCCSQAARESCIYKAHIANRILSGMEKETPHREETSTSGSKNVEEERIVGSETLSTSSRELSDINDSPVYCIQLSYQRQGTASLPHSRF